MARPKLLTDEQLAEAARRLALAGALSEPNLKKLVAGGQRERLLHAKKVGEAALRAEFAEPVMVYHEGRLLAVDLEPEVREGLLSQLRELARMTLLRSGYPKGSLPAAFVREIGGSGEVFEELRNPYADELVRLVTEYEAQLTLLRQRTKELRVREKDLESQLRDLQLENAELSQSRTEPDTSQETPPIEEAHTAPSLSGPTPVTQNSQDSTRPPAPPPSPADIQPDLFPE